MGLVKELLGRRLAIVLATVALSGLAISVSLWWNRQLSDIINEMNAKTAVAPASIGLVAVTVALSAGLSFGLALLSGWACETLAHDLRMGYARHFAGLTLPEIEGLNAGEQLSKLQNEITDVSTFLRGNLFSIVDDTIRFVGTFAYLICLNPKLALLANLPVAVLMWYTVWSSRRIGALAQASQQANAEMSGFAETLTTLFPVIKLFQAAPLLAARHGEALARWEDATIREERTRARLMSPSGAFSFLPLLLLFLIGGLQILQGESSIGVLYIFVNLSGNVSGVLMNLPGRIAGFRRFTANMARLKPQVELAGKGEAA